MYYVSNVEKFGENKTITNANKYINNLILGCKYHDQEEINKFMPYIDNTIPESFINLLI
jgi:enolase